VWELLVEDDDDETDEGGAGDGKGGDKTTTRRRRLLAFLLMPVGSLLSLPLGGLVGFVFGILWAVFGPSAPETPLSLKPAKTTRRDTPLDEEKEAMQLKAENDAEFTFETVQFTRGEHHLHCSIIKPKGDKKLKGAVIVQHGLHCHGGAPRSLKVGLHMAREGYVCYLPDCVGHGRSSGSWACVHSLDLLSQHLAYVASKVVDLHPSLPLFIQGESMGGMLVCYSPFFMTDATLSKLEGIVAVCPALMVHEDARDAFMEQFIRLWPLDLVKDVFPKFPATPGPKGNIFSADPKLNQLAEESIHNDPLEYTGNTKFSTGTTFLQRLLIEKNRKQLIRKVQTLEKPLLVLHGTGDKCVDISSSRELAKGLIFPNQKLVEYEGKCHVLLSEEEETRTKFLTDMTNFFDERLV
jgi:alpha-beta hydrolase superfamily lysophospholipase